jgi:hypothetical protein
MWKLIWPWSTMLVTTRQQGNREKYIKEKYSTVAQIAKAMSALYTL